MKTNKSDIRKHLKEVKKVARMINAELSTAGPERLELLAQELMAVSDMAANEVIDYCMENY